MHLFKTTKSMNKTRVHKVIATATILGLSAITLAACGKQAKASSHKEKIAVAISSELATLDPQHIVDMAGEEIVNNTEEPLVIVGKNNDPVPGIAKSWQISKDGKTYTFNLRHDARWNDGKKLTAKDFIYAWRRGVDPKTKGENAYTFSGVHNADAITAGKMAPNQLGITADGAYKLTVQLDHPISYFMQLIAEPMFLPEEQSAVVKYGAKYGTNAKYVAYDGPYTIRKWNGSGDSWTLMRNKHYWNNKHIHLDQVKYRVVKDASTALNMFDDGQLDQTALSGNQVQNERSSKSYVRIPSGTNSYIQVNQKSPSTPLIKKAMNNVDIRKALSLVVNRQQFVKHTLNDGSVAAKGIVSPGMARNQSGQDFADAAYVDNKLNSGVSYDPKLGKELFARGMKTIGATKLDVTLTADDDSSNDAVVQYLQNVWSKQLKGLNVTIKKVPKTTRLKYMVSGNFDIMLAGWNPNYGDPSTFLDMFATGNSYNVSHFGDAAYDKQVKIMDTTADAHARWNAMVSAEHILMQKQGVMPLYQISNSYLRNTKLKGVVKNSAAADPGWRGVYLKK